MKDEGHENKGDDHQLKKLLIAVQILLVSTLGNVKGAVRRICILMLGSKELITCHVYTLNHLLKSY